VRLIKRGAVGDRVLYEGALAPGWRIGYTRAGAFSVLDARGRAVRDGQASQFRNVFGLPHTAATGSNYSGMSLTVNVSTLVGVYDGQQTTLVAGFNVANYAAPVFSHCALFVCASRDKISRLNYSNATARNGPALIALSYLDIAASITSSGGKLFSLPLPSTLRPYDRVYVSLALEYVSGSISIPLHRASTLETSLDENIYFALPASPVSLAKVVGSVFNTTVLTERVALKGYLV
jgi:hypothetical protein